MTSDTQSNQLTKYSTASVRELLHISFPMMLAAVSGTLMMFMDRYILSQYSVDAMNAAASAGMVCAIFQFGGISVTAIAEVLVGEHNGAKRFNKVGEPVWQMVWFSIMASVIFLPTALYGAELLLPDRYEEHSIPYFRWIMLFGSAFLLTSAVSSFYVGRGKAKLVILSALLGNVLNFILDIILVFGVKGLVPAMGTEGAAIATVASQITQVLVLLVVFVSPANRLKYCTWNYQFNWKVFWECLHVGYPNAVGHMLEISAWALLMYFMTLVSSEHVTVFTIAQSVFILFVFFADGLQKGVIAVASNLIGAKQQQMISQLIKSSLLIYVGFAIVIAFPLVIYPELLIKGFITEDVFEASLEEVQWSARIAQIWNWFALVLDGFAWIMIGILTAGRDTKFVMFTNATTAWFFAIVPVYIFVVIGGAPSHVTTMIVAFYTLLQCACFFARYKSGKWLKEEAPVLA